jgi:hypothetical protein
MDEPMRLTKAFFVLPLMLLIALASSMPDEAVISLSVNKEVNGDGHL